MLQRGQGLAEDFQEAALHGQQRLPLGFLPLAAVFGLLGRRLRGPLGPGQRRWGQRLAVFSLWFQKQQQYLLSYIVFRILVNGGLGSKLEKLTWR